MSKYILELKAVFYRLLGKLFGKVIFRDKFGLKYYLWPDTRIGSTIKQGCRTDDEGIILLVQRILDKYNQKDSKIDRNNYQFIAFDVGAYIGIITLAIAQKLTPQDRLFAFEPSSLNFKRLVENIKLNKYKNISPIKYALSNQESTDTHLILTSDGGGNYIEANVESDQGKGNQEIISTTTLNKFCKEKEVERIDLLKIDAEGHDLQVLQGVDLLLKKSIFYIFIECQHPESKEFREILKIMEDNGYKTFYIVRHKDLVYRKLANYPYERERPPLNMLAISPQAPFDELALNLSLK